MRITQAMKELAKAVGGRVYRQDGMPFFKYDDHGSVYLSSEADFLETVNVYKGSHPDYEDALADYQILTGRRVV